MATGQQNAAVTALVVVAALAVLAVFPGARPSDTTQGLSSAQPVSFEMPPETTPAELADDGAQIVVSTCTACHSLEYIITQPRGMGEGFWRDEVTKMIKVYGAPIEPADAEAIAAILAKRFG